MVTLPTIAVVGLGYVGLPTALALLRKGIKVIGYDISEDRIDAIRAGGVDLIPADRERLEQFGSSPLFTMTTDPSLLHKASAVLICVPTPVDEHRVPDLRAIMGACQTAVAQARPGQTIILTSTTYVGCTQELLVGPLASRGFTVGENIHVAFSPERIDPGNTRDVQETVPRVIGGFTRACTEAASTAINLVAPMVHMVDNLAAAELTKILENTFRAVNIALINEFAETAKAFGVDITQVVTAASTKPYGFMPFNPGPGVGGHCIPCDPYYLLWQLPTIGASSPVIQAAMAANARRPSVIVRCVNETLADIGQSVNSARICIVGVAFKPNVADIRETPATEIIADLLHMGARVSYFDPMVDEFTVHSRQVPTGLPEADHYDLIVVLTTHTEHDYSWVGDHGLVIDASYRMDGIKHRILP